MKLETTGGLFMAHFTHIPTSETKLYEWLKAGCPSPPLPLVQTFCTLHKGPCLRRERPCSTPNALVGVARCSIMDTFIKSLGRKLAFERAASQLPRSERKEIWPAFLKLSKLPPRPRTQR